MQVQSPGGALIYPLQCTWLMMRFFAEASEKKPQGHIRCWHLHARGTGKCSECSTASVFTSLNTLVFFVSFAPKTLTSWFLRLGLPISVYSWKRLVVQGGRQKPAKNWLGFFLVQTYCPWKDCGRLLFSVEGFCFIFLTKAWTQSCKKRTSFLWWTVLAEGTWNMEHTDREDTTLGNSQHHNG